MRNKRLFTAMVAMVLAVVGAIAAVTSVLSATSQQVTSTLTVTYVANNVKATVSIQSAKKSASLITSFSAATDDATKSFDVTDASTTGTVEAAEVTLGFDSNTYYRCAVYKFDIKNDYAANHGTTLKVSATYVQGTAPTNVIIRWAQNTTGTTPTVALPADPAATWTDAFAGGTEISSMSNNSGSPTLLNNAVAQQEHTYLFLFVCIEDSTLSSSFALDNSNVLQFYLAPTAA